MSEVNLSELRHRVEATENPYKVVRRDAVEYVGRLEDKSKSADFQRAPQKSVYRVDGTMVLVNEMVSRQLDELIGLTPKQAKMVMNASGEEGIRDFRNYLATASSMITPLYVALIGNPASRTVTGLVPIKDDPITSDAFFDFLEVFLEKNKLIPTRYEMAYDIAAGLTLYLDSSDLDIRKIAPYEDFLVNSYYIKWNLGQIELGRYYERLVCSNGQTETILQKEARVTSLQKESIGGLMRIPHDGEMLNKSFGRFSNKALEAMEVRASIAELKLISEKLDSFLVDRNNSTTIAPYFCEMWKYKDAGYDCDPRRFKSMKASMTVWELYNAVTDYASNNRDWPEDDNRRGLLQGEAFKFLMRERDVRNYSDVFA